MTTTGHKKSRLRGWLVLLAVLAAAMWWFYVARPNIHPIIPGEAWRSAQLSDDRLEALVRENGIRTIINLRPPEAGAGWYEDELAVADRLDLDYHNLGLFQVKPRIDQVSELVELIDNVDRPFLVHCRAGADRTGLAAVVTLLLQGEQSLDTIDKQASWRYGAIRPDSMGKPFMAEYRQWLSEKGYGHSPDRLREWVDHGYVDKTGNIHFLVHPIRGKSWFKPLGRYSEGEAFEIDRSSEPVLKIDGWAYDAQASIPLTDIRIFLGSEPFESVELGSDSSWLLDDIGPGAPTRAGWKAEKSLSQMKAGCSDLVFHFQRADGGEWRSPPAGRICFD